MEHRRNLEMKFAGMLAQNIDNTKLATFSQVISALPRLDGEESAQPKFITSDRPPAAIDHRGREPSASPSTGTPVRPHMSRSSDRRRRSSRSTSRRSRSPSHDLQRERRSRRSEYEEYGDRRPRRAYSSRSRSRQHRPAAEPQFERDLRTINMVREHERMKRENEELRAQLGELSCFVSCAHSRVCHN